MDNNAEFVCLLGMKLVLLNHICSSFRYCFLGAEDSSCLFLSEAGALFILIWIRLSESPLWTWVRGITNNHNTVILGCLEIISQRNQCNTSQFSLRQILRTRSESQNITRTLSSLVTNIVPLWEFLSPMSQSSPHSSKKTLAVTVCHSRGGCLPAPRPAECQSRRGKKEVRCSTTQWQVFIQYFILDIVKYSTVWKTVDD